MEESTEYGHEGNDLNPVKIALFGAILLAVVAASAAVSYFFLRYAAVRSPLPQVVSSPPPARAREPAPAPRLQVQGAKELREMHEAEERVLHSYAWIDREKGIVRIPVERAMELLATKEKVKRQKDKQ